MADHRPPPPQRFSLRSQAFRGVLYQMLAIGVIALALAWLAHNTLENMRVRGIQSGFGFLGSPAGFDIGESLFPYESSDSYWRAFLVGIVNTLRVAVIGIVATTVLGTLVGIGRFSRNALVRGICYGYVELFRNIPVLLQLLMWYLLFTEMLPPISDAINLGLGIWVSKSGLSIPVPVWQRGQTLALCGAVLGLVAALAWRRYAQLRFEQTGRPLPTFLPGVALVLGIALLGWLVGGAPTAWDVPVKGEVIVDGGAAATPEYVSVLLGLVMYTGTYVAEVVRGGIQSVAHGQGEAASALGLSRGQSMRLIVLPQALRVIIPPLTNQYLNLTKNSSLAVAIGYPDVVAVSNTAINQTGRAVECIAVIMLVYLSTSLGTSALMGWYNKRVAILER
jgi:general L-amino acid transport system permease protein